MVQKNRVLSVFCSSHTFVIPGVSNRERKGRKEAEKNRLNPDCAVCKGKCGRTDNYDLEEMETDEPSDRARKEQILGELFPMPEKLQRIRKETKEQNEELKVAVNFLYKALFAIGNYVGEKSLHSVVQEMNNLFEKLENVLR